MLTFAEFVEKAIDRGQLINTMFEEHLFSVVGILERIALPLNAEAIPYELIGGMAVMIQVHQVDPSEVRLTKDIDIMIRRSDLERIRAVAHDHGFTFRHVAGIDMLMPEGETKAKNAIHLVFSEERTSSKQAVPNPPIRPEILEIHGVPVSVIPIVDLVQMKLSNYRDIDRVHVADMDRVGLITPAVESALPAELLERLCVVRESQ